MTTGDTADRGHFIPMGWLAHIPPETSLEGIIVAPQQQVGNQADALAGGREP